MSVAPGYVFDLRVRSEVGPWSDDSKPHPGVILGVSQETAAVVPLSSSKPRSGPDRGHVKEITDGGDFLATPIWAYCHHLTSVPRSQFQGLAARGRLADEELAPIRIEVARFLGLNPRTRS